MKKKVICIDCNEEVESYSKTRLYCFDCRTKRTRERARKKKDEYVNEKFIR